MKVLIFAPHGDDEVLGLGGTIAKFVEENNEVYVAIVSTGSKELFDESLVNKARNEIKQAHEYLKIKETFFLGFDAAMLNEVPRHILNKRILDMICKVRPDIVFLPHFGDMHIDHFLVAQSVMVGVRPINGMKITELYSYETLSETEWNTPHSANSFLPNTFVDISKYIDVKVSAMEIFESQLRKFPHPRSSKAIKALANLRGSSVGVDAAEAFCLIRKIII
jgi:LmbE family N-acetylglucosaminyl deacetylase